MSALEAARGLIGTRFRLHGRSRDGVDCVGLVALSLRVEVPSGYALRSGDIGAVIAAVRAAGLVPGVGAAGELLLLRVGAGQLHLGIASEDGGLVHADAMLRRVVEQPGPLPWPVIGCWRRLEE